MSDILRVLSSPVRRAIIARLWDGEHTAGEIAAGFDITPATVSSHLRVLREAGVVAVRAEGNRRWYRADKEAFHGLQSALFEQGFDEGWLPPGETMRPPPTGAGISELRRIYETRLVADLAATPESAFRHFVEPALMERWCGRHVAADPVEGGRFAFSVALGLRVEGEYIRLVPGALAVMRWMPSLGGMKLPMGDNVMFILLAARAHGTRIDIRQQTRNRIAASFLDRAWRQYFPRLCEAIDAGPDTDPARGSS